MIQVNIFEENNGCFIVVEVGTNNIIEEGFTEKEHAQKWAESNNYTVISAKNE